MIVASFAIYLACAALIWKGKRKAAFFLTLANICFCLFIFLYFAVEI